MQVLRHDLRNKIVGQLIRALVINQNFTRVRTQVIAQRTNDDVAFLVNQEGRGTLAGHFLNRGPQSNQIIDAPLQLFGGLAQPRRAHNDAHFVRNGDAIQGFAHFTALRAFDAPRDAAGFGIIGHQHHKRPRQADVAGQCRAFVATLLFFHLNDEFGAFFEDIRNAKIFAACGLVSVVGGIDFFKREKTMTL